MNVDLTLVLVISFIASAIIILVTISWVYGNVFLAEDQVLLCLSAVWTNVSNDVACKVYFQDDLHEEIDIESIYAEIMKNKDTFDLGDIE